jgi:iron complex transport system ATP-binding protein
MSAPLLQATGVTVALRGRNIVRDASLALRAGEFTVLVGPNGAGKTTLVRALAGLIGSAGAITLGDNPLPSLSEKERAKRLAYLPQGHIFHWPLAVAAIVALGRMPHRDAFTPLTDADRAAVSRAIAATQLEAFATRPITTLSGGERARVAIARALATDAPILLADEPTASLDARHQLKVMGLLRDAAHRGTAVLAVIHDLALAARFADRVIVMNDGRIVADDVPARALTAERIGEVFGVAVGRMDTPEGPALIPLSPL